MAKVLVEETAQSFEYWASRPYLKKETQERVKGVSVLLVPQEGFRGDNVRTFPVRSEELYHLLQEQVGKEYPVDIAIEEEDYKELALHGAIFELGMIVASHVAVPLVIHVIAHFIAKRIENRSKPEDAEVRFQLIVEEKTENTAKCKKITYDGPAGAFSSEMEKIIKSISAPPSPVVDPPKK